MERSVELLRSMLPIAGAPQGRGFVWLDGGAFGSRLFRDPLAEIESVRGGATFRAGGRSVLLPGRSLDGLQAVLRAYRGLEGAVLAGWISYDVGAELEGFGPLDAADEPMPRMWFGLYNSMAIGSEPKLDKAPIAPVRETGPDFRQSVERIVGRIHAGDLFQTNLCRRLEADVAIDAIWPLYNRIRTLAQPEYGAYIDAGGGRAILSASPELFLRVKGTTVESKPIKGTRPRGRTDAEDQANLADLLTSEKDRAELAMVVDVTRNDLSRVCLPGTVRVAEHAVPMTLPTLHHTYSRVTGELREGVDAADLLRAAFPPASITGAPKIAAMEAAFREEGRGRGPCMGAIGWISLTGDLELSVAIRTAYVANGKATYLAGCGITAESDRDAELAESRTKAQLFVNALAGE